jgi:hypothetical protein
MEFTATRMPYCYEVRDRHGRLLGLMSIHLPADQFRLVAEDNEGMYECIIAPFESVPGTRH